MCNKTKQNKQNIYIYNYAHTILCNINICRMTSYYTSANFTFIEIEFITINNITSVKLTLFRHNTGVSIASITVHNITFIIVRVNN